jgi:plasmid replication initiation protein
VVLPRRPRPFARADDRPGYFALTGGIERWLYRVARRHAGHQPKGWAFELRHLYAKSGSAACFSDFALDLRRIAARQTLPGYDLFIELDNTRELLRVVPRRLSTGAVDVVWKLSADQAHALSADQAQDYPPIRRINRG